MGDLTDNTPLLYRCSLGSAITLCPSLPRFLPSLAPLFGQFNHGAMTQAPPAPFLFHHVVTLSRELRHFTGFLSPVSLPFVLVNPSTRSACIVLCSVPLSLFPVSVSPGHLLCVEGKKKKKQAKSHNRLADVGGGNGNFSPCSSPHPPYVPDASLHLSFTSATAVKGTQQSNTC